jgi:hypothetical protein
MTITPSSSSAHVPRHFDCADLCAYGLFDGGACCVSCHEDDSMYLCETELPCGCTVQHCCLQTPVLGDAITAHRQASREDAAFHAALLTHHQKETPL